MKVAFDVYAQWITGGDEVFHDDVDDVLMEDFYVAEGVYVELQTLQLDTALVRNIRDPDGGEVGEVGERADGSELRNLEIDLDLTARKLVRKRVQRKEIHLRAWRGLNIKTLLVRRRQWTFSCGHRHDLNHKEITLCNLCVLCVSVVYLHLENSYHRDAENTEVAQRRNQ